VWLVDTRAVLSGFALRTSQGQSPQPGYRDFPLAMSVRIDGFDEAVWLVPLTSAVARVNIHSAREVLIPSSHVGRLNWVERVANPSPLGISVDSVPARKVAGRVSFLLLQHGVTVRGRWSSLCCGVPALSLNGASSVFEVLPCLSTQSESARARVPGARAQLSAEHREYLGRWGVFLSGGDTTRLVNKRDFH
jgi:hypothetical protein